MTKTSFIILGLLIFICLVSFNTIEDGKIEKWEMPEIQFRADNPYSDESIDLGAALFSENLFSQEVYMKQLSQTVIIAIDSARAGYEANLKTGMNLDYDKYPIYAALTDLQEYHRRCSFYYGLVEISKALSNKKPTLKELNAKITELEQSLSKSIKNPVLSSSKHHPELIERLDQLKLERSKTYN